MKVFGNSWCVCDGGGDRNSGRRFRTRTYDKSSIKSHLVVQFRQVRSMVRSSKPVLVILDEIDGATGAGENVSILAEGCLWQLRVPRRWEASSRS